MRLLLLAGMLAQLIPGLWFLDAPKEYRGLTEGSAITFSVPVDKLAAGTYVQFGVTLENGGPQAPRHYIVEAQEGAEWVRVGEPFTDGRSDYSFVAAKSEDLHPSTYLTVFPLRKPVRDSLRVRCRVCSQYATDGSTLSAAADGNTVHLMARCYVAGRLNPLGRHLPVAHKSVLLIGNSFTYFYGVPFMLQEIAWSQGMWLNISTSLKGGQTLRQHCGLELSLRACSSHPYDFAFIQGQSQEPAQYASDLVGGRDVKAALCQLCDNIRGVSPDCSIYVEQTWAYPAGDCGGFGSLERFDGLLAAGAAKLALAGRAGVSPVGPAFAAVRDGSSGIALLGPDNKHQSAAGSYLKACVEYLVISGKPFRGPVPSCGLSDSDAQYLRTIAESIVLK